MDRFEGVALLDRDGTVIAERNYLSDPADIELLPNAAAGLRELRSMGFRLVLITNQSGVGRGYFTVDTVNAVHARLAELLREEGVTLDGVFFCPHVPEDGCACRKPEPGMVWAAAKELDFDPASAVVFGDKPCDIDLARRVGAGAVLVTTGYGAEHAGTVQADVVAADLADAAKQVRQWLQVREKQPRCVPSTDA